MEFFWEVCVIEEGTSVFNVDRFPLLPNYQVVDLESVSLFGFNC